MKFKVLFGLILLVNAYASSEDEEFENLMGKGTEHWCHITQDEDLLILEKFKALYQKNKSFLNVVDGEFKIPRVIHFIWIGPRPFPPLSVENIRTWIAKNPDWKVKFWTDRERPPPCNGMEVKKIQDFPFLFLGRCFDESQNYGEKSDILRFEILYQEGGLYVDHDANCLKNFDNLHRGYDLYCGFETPHPLVAGMNITAGIGVIGSRAEHPLIKMVIELISSHWGKIAKKYKGMDGYSRTQLVMERTYVMLTQALKKYRDQEQTVDIVFPAAYFFAKKGVVPLYSKHFFANAWADDDEKNREFEKNARRTMNKIKQKNRTIRMVGKSVLTVNLVAFIGIFLYLIRKKKHKNKVA